MWPKLASEAILSPFFSGDLSPPFLSFFLSFFPLFPTITLAFPREHRSFSSIRRLDRFSSLFLSLLLGVSWIPPYSLLNIAIVYLSANKRLQHIHTPPLLPSAERATAAVRSSPAVRATARERETKILTASTLLRLLAIKRLLSLSRSPEVRNDRRCCQAGIFYGLEFSVTSTSERRGGSEKKRLRDA